MFVVPDVALERRRAQNRMAQRRFREKIRRNAAADQRSEGTPLPAPEHAPIQIQYPPAGDASWLVGPATAVDEGTNPPADPTPPTRLASGASESLGSAHVASFDVSSGACLHSQGLLMGNIDFLTFDRGPEPQATHGTEGPARPGPLPARPGTAMSQDVGGNGATGGQSGHANATSTNTTTYINMNENSCDSGGAGDDEAPWLGPLHMAAARGHARIVRILLGHTTDANEPDGHGRTPLMHAVAGGSEDVLHALLANGARVAGAEDRAGRSALHWAVAHRRVAFLRRLLEHCRAQVGADGYQPPEQQQQQQKSQLGSVLDKPDRTGRTPLHMAIDMGLEAGVLLLLEHGADPSVRAPQ